MQYLFWNLDSGVLRFSLRVYFIVVLFLLGIIGRQCAKSAAKVELLKGNSVRLNRMTGWLHANDIAIVMWRLHELPGGWWLGTMMIVTSILSLTSDLVVTRLINPTLRQGLCDFGGGLVMNWDNLTWSMPPPDGYPALIASNAQIPSSEDFYGCKVGIYRKVPWDGDPYFCATDEDVMGRWNCTDLHNDLTWPANTDLDGIGLWLENNNLQYHNRSRTDVQNGYGNTTHVVYWSSSAATDDSQLPWDVRVSVDMNVSLTDDKTFNSFQCVAEASRPEYIKPINMILSNMTSISTLRQWVSGLARICYMGDDTGASMHLKEDLEQYLNTLTMVEGGSNSILHQPRLKDLPYYPYYGCLTSQAKIHPIILVLVPLAGLLLLVTCSYYLLLLSRLYTHFITTKLRPNSHTSIPNIKPVPDSTLSWILQAARESALETEHMSTAYRGAPPTSPAMTDMSGTGISVPSKERELRDWRFEVVDMPAGVARVVRRHGKMVEPVMSSTQPQQEMAYAQNVFGANGYGQQGMGQCPQWVVRPTD